jgi:serine-type D-Ala-D-Ala carboxypeptidase/endopeptidase (penicillin-binding protein 4)
MFKFLPLVLFVVQIFAVDHEMIGVYAVNMKTGEVLIDENSEKSLIPASCMKVVTTGAALHLLDPLSQFQTDLEYDGSIEQGTLKGNLYIKGGGDPCLGSDRFSSWKEQIETWVAAVSKLGIKKIQGKVIGDGSRWEKPMAIPSWLVEDIGNYYGACASALSFHENYYSLFFRPGLVGNDATILRAEPPFASLLFQNDVKTGPEGSGDQACIYGSEYSLARHIRGTIPAGVEEFSIKGSVPDPATLCAELLSQALKARGILVEQNVIQPNQRVSFHTTLSPPMKEIIHWINQKSINLYAEHMLKRIGEVVKHEGSTAAGIAAVRDFWKSQGIDLEGFNMIDGSGLSRKNLITPRQLVSILLKMKNSKPFLDSLPPLGEKAHAKSGSMSLVKCYAGYAGDAAFAIMVNQHTDAQKAGEKINQYLTRLAY